MEATYKQIRDYIKAKHGNYPKDAWIAHVKEIHGLVKPNRERKIKCPAWIKPSIEEAFLHFNMILEHEPEPSATNDQIRDYIKKTHGSHIKDAWIVHVKEIHGLVNPKPRRQVKCPAWMKPFIEEAFRHFEMIPDQESEGGAS